MEEIKKAVHEFSKYFAAINGILVEYRHQYNTVAYDMLKDGLSVEKLAVDMLMSDQFTDQELNSLISVSSSFGRHLAEVEQSLYEEIGSEKFEQLQLLLKEKSRPSNFIYYHLGLDKKR